jgi:hypothetical protein
MHTSDILVNVIYQINSTTPAPTVRDPYFDINFAKASQWGFFAVNVGVAIPLGVITFICLVVLTIMKKQPITSRHVAPYLGLVYIVLNAILAIIFKLLLYFTVIYNDNQQYYWFFLVALQQGAAISYIVQVFLRFC